MGEEVAEAGGGFLVTPWQGVRAGVVQGTGAPIGQTHFVSDYAAARCDEWGKGAPGGTLELQRLELLARREQELTLERGVCGVGLGLAGGEGRAIPRQGEGIAGTEPEEVIRAPQRA